MLCCNKAQSNFTCVFPHLLVSCCIKSVTDSEIKTCTYKFYVSIDPLTKAYPRWSIRPAVEQTPLPAYRLLLLICSLMDRHLQLRVMPHDAGLLVGSSGILPAHLEASSTAASSAAASDEQTTGQPGSSPREDVVEDATAEDVVEDARDEDAPPKKKQRPCHFHSATLPSGTVLATGVHNALITTPDQFMQHVLTHPALIRPGKCVLFCVDGHPKNSELVRSRSDQIYFPWQSDAQIMVVVQADKSQPKDTVCIQPYEDDWTVAFPRIVRNLDRFSLPDGTTMPVKFGIREMMNDTSGPPGTAWGLRMNQKLLLVAMCERCGLATTSIGALMLDWRATAIRYPSGYPTGGATWTCPPCLGSDYRMQVHCGRCQLPIWQDELEEPNLRPQSASGDDDDLELWCPDCSVNHSGNFTG